MLSGMLYFFVQFLLHSGTAHGHPWWGADDETDGDLLAALRSDALKNQSGSTWKIRILWRSWNCALCNMHGRGSKTELWKVVVGRLLFFSDDVLQIHDVEDWILIQGMKELRRKTTALQARIDARIFRTHLSSRFKILKNQWAPSKM